MSASTIPTAQELEDYRHHRDLLRALTKIQELYSYGSIPDIVKKQLFFAYYLYGKEEPEKDIDADLRESKIQHLRSKINLFQQNYFTAVDYENLRAESYLEDGLEAKLRDNELSLQLRCRLALEPAEVIAAIGCRLFRKTITPTNPTAMIEYFRDKYYNINALPVGPGSTRPGSLSAADEISWHFKSVRYGHEHYAREYFELNKSVQLLDLCMNYLSIKDGLPDYVLKHIDWDPKSAFTIDDLIKKYPGKIRTIYIGMLTRSVGLCDINAITKYIDLVVTNDDADRDHIVSIIINVTDGFRPNTYSYEGLKELMLLYWLTQFNWFFYTIFDNVGTLGNEDSPYGYRLLVARARQNPDDLANIPRMWDLTYHMDIFELYPRFESMVEIHDIRFLSGGRFDYNAMSQFLFRMEDGGKLIDPANKICFRRILFYLKQLDVMAERSDKSLDYEAILNLAIQTEYMDLCSWVLDTATQRQIEINISQILNAYFYRIGNVGSVDLPWFFNLVNQFQDSISFVDAYKVLNLVFGLTSGFASIEVSYDMITQIFIWLESKTDIDYVEAVRHIGIGKRVSKSNIERNLLILMWVDLRIRDSGRETPYYRLSQIQAFNNTIINEWVLQKMTSQG